MANIDPPATNARNGGRSPGAGSLQAGHTPSANGGPRRDRAGSKLWLGAVALTVLMIAWLLLGLTVGRGWSAVASPKAQIGVEAASALARLFGALVLFLFPSEQSSERLRWVAGGFVVSGLGGLVFGYLPPLLGITSDLNTLIYASLVVRCVSGALFLEGLFPGTPSPFTRRTMLITLSVFAALSIMVVGGTALLPPLVHVADLEAAAVRRENLLSALTAWHFVLSSLPLALAIAAVAGAIRHYRREQNGGWLVIAMLLLAGSQLHTIFWPSVYTVVLTTADVLRFAFATVVAVGGVLELRRIATERAVLLAAEREQSQRLGELAVLKADFTAMVAHELGNPLAAIRGFADVLSTRQLGPDQQAEAIGVILSEANVLSAVLADMQAAAAVERVDFAVELQPMSLALLIADAASYARTLPGDHPLTVEAPSQVGVCADSYRIGQVLRNLLGNAAKYSPPGAPIELRATVDGARVRLEVIDHGNGIHPHDMARIFEKFGRGRDLEGRNVPGVGLGLYLSRRIIQAHGADLEVRSTAGVGSVFGFELRVVEAVHDPAARRARTPRANTR